MIIDVDKPRACGLNGGAGPGAYPLNTPPAAGHTIGPRFQRIARARSALLPLCFPHRVNSRIDSHEFATWMPAILDTLRVEAGPRKG